MSYKCGAICDLDKVEALLQSMPKELSKFQQSCLLSYMEDNQNVRTCPSQPWCGRAIQVWTGCGEGACGKCGS